MSQESSRKTYRIRKAVADDGPRLLELIHALADYESLSPPDHTAGERLLRDAFGAHPRFDVYLSTVDDRAVGYAVVFETYSTFLALPTLFLEDLFVLPDHRGYGAGKALFLHCVREALRRGCGRMDWTVLDWNASARAFYHRLGARHLSDWEYYRLDGEAMRRLLERQPDGSFIS